MKNTETINGINPRDKSGTLFSETSPKELNHSFPPAVPLRCSFGASVSEREERLAKFTESTLSLCYLIGNSNGDMNHFETRMYEFIKHQEGIPEETADLILSEIGALSHKYILEKGIKALSQCEKPDQIKCLAWMNRLANADGYLADQEWSIIYQIYNKELDITLEEILEFELPELDYTFYVSQN